MSWIFLALLAPAIDTVTNYIDKYLIGDRIQDSRVITVYMAIVGLFAGTLLWLWQGPWFLSPRDTLLVLTAGVLGFYSIVYYFKALDFEETSIVILFFQLSPVITLILSWLFLGEIITFEQFLGFILILGASIAVSLKDSKGFKNIKIASSFWYVNASNILWAVGAVMLKFTMNTEGFLVVLPYESWGIALGGLIMIVVSRDVRHSFVDHMKQIRKGTIGTLFLNEFIGLAGKWTMFLAFSIGLVALVDVVAGIQVFYGIAAGFILTRFFPGFFKEDISKKGLSLKIVAAITMFVGIVLLSY